MELKDIYPEIEDFYRGLDRKKPAIKETYKLHSTRLVDILKDIYSHEMRFFLRSRGIEINDDFQTPSKQGSTSVTVGMLVYGTNLGKKSSTDLYLVTFDNSQDKALDSMNQAHDVVDVLRDYII